MCNSHNHEHYRDSARYTSLHANHGILCGINGSNASGNFYQRYFGNMVAGCGR